MIRKRIKKLKHKFDHNVLAQRYPNFAKHVHISTKGEQIIDFKNQESLVELNYSIMDHYFKVKDFRTPLDNLAPCLGNRINYLEWVKELVDLYDYKLTHIYDIGTGSSGVFLFLAWRLYGWKGIGVDTDQVAIANATEIALINKAPCQFYVGDTFSHLENGMVVVCNPPFYAEGEERPQFRQISNAETYTEGGEAQFINKMMSSATKQCLYTSLVGRRSSLSKIRGIEQQIELKQGNNMRYGISWIIKT